MARLTKAPANREAPIDPSQQQLLAENGMSGVASEQNIADNVQAAALQHDLPMDHQSATAVQHAKWLNAARNLTPVKISPPKSLPVSRSLQQPQATGKLKRPSLPAGDPAKGSKRRGDTYALSISPEQTSKTTTRKDGTEGAATNVIAKPTEEQIQQDNGTDNAVNDWEAEPWAKLRGEAKQRGWFQPYMTKVYTIQRLAQEDQGTYAPDEGKEPHKGKGGKKAQEQWAAGPTEHHKNGKRLSEASEVENEENERYPKRLRAARTHTSHAVVPIRTKKSDIRQAQEELVPQKRGKRTKNTWSKSDLEAAGAERKPNVAARQSAGSSSGKHVLNGVGEELVDDVDEVNPPQDAIVEAHEDDSVPGGHQEPSPGKIQRSPPKGPGHKPQKAMKTKVRSRHEAGPTKTHKPPTETHAAIKTNDAVREHADEARPSPEDTNEDSDYSEEEEENDAIDFLGEKTHLDDIFDFIKKGPCKGRSRTQTVAKIRVACRQAHELFQSKIRDGIEMDETDLEDTLRDIRTMVGILRASEQKKDRAKLVQDAYARLYHSLAVLFVAMWKHYSFSATQDPTGEEELKLEALANLTLYMRVVIDLENTIKGWDVGQSSAKGFIKAVRNDFIAPLKRIHTLFLKEVHRLRKERDAHIARLRILESQQRREEEALRKAELAREDRKRWAKWQALHIARMLVEPDVRLHSHLTLSNNTERAEVDANGNRFERLAVFKDRMGPFGHYGSPVEMPDWTDEQKQALLDGLEKYRGPLVYERIFKRYCRPGSPLRLFNVEEITQQAAYLTSMYIKYKESQEQEPEEWVKDVPVFR